MATKASNIAQAAHNVDTKNNRVEELKTISCENT